MLLADKQPRNRYAVGGRQAGDDFAALGAGQIGQQVGQNGEFRVAGASSGASAVWRGRKWRLCVGYDGRIAARHAGGHWFKSSTAQCPRQWAKRETDATGVRFSLGAADGG